METIIETPFGNVIATMEMDFSDVYPVAVYTWSGSQAALDHVGRGLGFTISNPPTTFVRGVISETDPDPKPSLGRILHAAGYTLKTDAIDLDATHDRLAKAGFMCSDGFLMNVIKQATTLPLTSADFPVDQRIPRHHEHLITGHPRSRKRRK